MSGTIEGTPGWETTIAYLSEGYDSFSDDDISKNKKEKKKKKNGKR